MAGIHTNTMGSSSQPNAAGPSLSGWDTRRQLTRAVTEIISIANREESNITADEKVVPACNEQEMSIASLASYVIGKLSSTTPLEVTGGDMTGRPQRSASTPRLTAVWRPKSISYDSPNPNTSPFKEDGTLLKLLRSKSMPLPPLGVEETSPIRTTRSSSPPPPWSLELENSAMKSTTTSPQRRVTSRSINPKANLDMSIRSCPPAAAAVTTPPSTPCDNLPADQPKLVRSASDGHVWAMRKKRLRCVRDEFPSGTLPSVRNLKSKFDKLESDSMSADENPELATPRAAHYKTSDEVDRSSGLGSDQVRSRRRLSRHESLKKWEQDFTEQPPPNVYDLPLRSVKKLLLQFENTSQVSCEGDVFHEGTSSVPHIQDPKEKLPDPLPTTGNIAERQVQSDPRPTVRTDMANTRPRAKSEPDTSSFLRQRSQTAPVSVKKLKLQFEKKPVQVDDTMVSAEATTDIAYEEHKGELISDQSTLHGGGTDVSKEENLTKHEKQDSPHREIVSDRIIAHMQTPSVKNLRKQFEEAPSAQSYSKTVGRDVANKTHMALKLDLRTPFESTLQDQEPITLQKNSAGHLITREAVPSNSVRNLLRQFESVTPGEIYSEEDQKFSFEQKDTGTRTAPAEEDGKEEHRLTTSPSLDSTAQPSLTTSPSLDSTAQPSLTTSPSIDSTAQPNLTTSPSLNSTAQPSLTTFPSIDSTAQLSLTTSPSIDSTAQPNLTTSPSLDSTAQPSLTTSPSIDSTAQPSLTTSPSLDSTAQPSLTTSPSLDSTAQPSLTTSPSLDSTAQPSLTTSPFLDSTAQPSLTTSPSLDSTAQPSLTTSPSLDSTAQPSLTISPSLGSTTQRCLIISPAFDSTAPKLEISTYSMAGLHDSSVSVITSVNDEIRLQHVKPFEKREKFDEMTTEKEKPIEVKLKEAEETNERITEYWRSKQGDTEGQNGPTKREQEGDHEMKQKQEEMKDKQVEEVQRKQEKVEQDIQENGKVKQRKTEAQQTEQGQGEEVEQERRGKDKTEQIQREKETAEQERRDKEKTEQTQREKEKTEQEREEKEEVEREAKKKEETQETRIEEKSEKRTGGGKSEREETEREKNGQEKGKKKEEEEKEVEKSKQEWEEKVKTDQQRCNDEGINKVQKKKRNEEHESERQQEQDKKSDVCDTTEDHFFKGKKCEGECQGKKEITETSEDHNSESSDGKVGKLIERFTNIHEFDFGDGHREDGNSLQVPNEDERRLSDVASLVEMFANINKKRETPLSDAEEEAVTDFSTAPKAKEAAPIPTFSAKNVPGKVRTLRVDELRFFNSDSIGESFIRSQSLRVKKIEPPPFTQPRCGSLREKKTKGVASDEAESHSKSSKALPRNCRRLRPDELRFFGMGTNNTYSIREARKIKYKEKEKKGSSDTGKHSEKQFFRIASQGDPDKGGEHTGVPGDGRGASVYYDADSDSDGSTMRDSNSDEMYDSDDILIGDEPNELEITLTNYEDDDYHPHIDDEELEVQYEGTENLIEVVECEEVGTEYFLVFSSRDFPDDNDDEGDQGTEPEKENDCATAARENGASTDSEAGGATQVDFLSFGEEHFNENIDLHTNSEDCRKEENREMEHRESESMQNIVSKPVDCVTDQIGSIESLDTLVVQRTDVFEDVENGAGIDLAGGTEGNLMKPGKTRENRAIVISSQAETCGSSGTKGASEMKEDELSIDEKRSDRKEEVTTGVQKYATGQDVGSEAPCRGNGADYTEEKHTVTSRSNEVQMKTEVSPFPVCEQSILKEETLTHLSEPNIRKKEESRDEGRGKGQEEKTELEIRLIKTEGNTDQENQDDRGSRDGQINEDKLEDAVVQLVLAEEEKNIGEAQVSPGRSSSSTAEVLPCEKQEEFIEEVEEREKKEDIDDETSSDADLGLMDDILLAIDEETKREEIPMLLNLPLYQRDPETVAAPEAQHSIMSEATPRSSVEDVAALGWMEYDQRKSLENDREGVGKETVFPERRGSGANRYREGWEGERASSYFWQEKVEEGAQEVCRESSDFLSEKEFVKLCLLAAVFSVVVYYLPLYFPM